MATSAERLVVRSSVQVPLGPAAAFALFTERMAEWWPLATKSVYNEAATGVVLEPGEGGRLMETATGGRTAEWGRVTVWDPPQRLGFTWHPGEDDRIVTQVEVTFSQVGNGTRVDLVHSGWEAKGERAGALLESYAPGWENVLGRFAARARDVDGGADGA